MKTIQVGYACRKFSFAHAAHEQTKVPIHNSTVKIVFFRDQGCTAHAISTKLLYPHDVFATVKH